jgi:hypothetical protein
MQQVAITLDYRYPGRAGVLLSRGNDGFCDSALLSQLTTFEFYGGAPGHALHMKPYQK